LRRHQDHYNYTCVHLLATAAARDAAGNISLQDVQKAQEMFSEKQEKQD